MRFITGEVADLDSPYRYWASEVKEGVWNWSYNHTRTGCYYFVKEQDMAFFLLKWNR